MKANKILLGTCLAGMLATSGAYAGYMCDWFGVWCDDTSSMSNTLLGTAPAATSDVPAPVAPVAPAPTKQMAPSAAPGTTNVAPPTVTPPLVAPAPTPAPVAPAPGDVTAPAEDNTAVISPAPAAAPSADTTGTSAPGDEGMNTETGMPQ